MDIQVKRKMIILAGATASGKTALAAELIQKYPTEIVSADSRQVYKRLDIGTGKDKTVPQHMIDVVEPIYCHPESCEGSNKRFLAGLEMTANVVGSARLLAEMTGKYSVAKYRDQALEIIEDIWQRGKTPLIVGGTGFYIDSLIYEQNTNSTPPNRKLRAKLSQLSNNRLLMRIAKIDKETAESIDKNNRARLIRAAEIVTITGKPIEKCKSVLRSDIDINIFVLDMPRGELYARIDKRVDDRIDEGMVEEVQGLLDSGVDPNWLISLGLEYRFITEYLLSVILASTRDKSTAQAVISTARQSSRGWRNLLRNIFKISPPSRPYYAEATKGRQSSRSRDDMTYEEMIQKLKYAIHAYARRQNTYFKRWGSAKWLPIDIIKDEIGKIFGEK